MRDMRFHSGRQRRCAGFAFCDVCEDGGNDRRLVNHGQHFERTTAVGSTLLSMSYTLPSCCIHVIVVHEAGDLGSLSVLGLHAWRSLNTNAR